MDELHWSHPFFHPVDGHTMDEDEKNVSWLSFQRWITCVVAAKNLSHIKNKKNHKC
jgi:hypothetical protein